MMSTTTRSLDELNDSDFNIYFYNPSHPLPIISIFLYLIPIIWLSYLLCIIRTSHPRRRFLFPALVGAVLEVLGYVFRTLSVWKVNSVPYYATQTSLIVLAPLLLTASLYILVSHHLLSQLSSTSPSTSNPKPNLTITRHIHIPHLPYILISSDILSFLLQCSGTGIASAWNWEGSLSTTGTNVLISGLSLQVFSFSIFILLTSYLDFFLNRVKSSLPLGWRKLFMGIYVTIILVLVRTPSSPSLSPIYIPPFHLPLSSPPLSPTSTSD